MSTLDSFDRLVLSIIAGLVLAIGSLLALGDHVGVRVTDVSPEEGSSPPVTAPIQIAFGQPMQVASVEERFSIRPPVEGQFEWDGNTLIFRPAQALSPEQTYTVTLEAGAESSAGRRTLEAVSWSFRPRQPGIVYLAPADAADRGLWFLPAEGGEPSELFTPRNGIFDLAPAPDGSEIALTLAEDEPISHIWLVSRSGDSARQLFNCAPAACSTPAWSADGELLAYVRREPSSNGLAPGRIWLYDLASGETAPLFQDNQVLGFGPVWSPDGSRLAFFDGNAQAIRVLELESGRVTVIPSLMGEVGSFSPDGGQMVYTDIRQVGRQYFPQLWLADLSEEGGIRPLLDEAEEDSSPAWSPRGEWIAFARRRLDRQGGPGSQLMLINPESGELRQITDDAAYNNTGFQWDPTGQRLLIQRFNLETGSARAEIWLYDLGDESLARLVENGFGGQWLP